MRLFRGLLLVISWISFDVTLAQHKCTEVTQGAGVSLSTKKLFHFDTNKSKITFNLTQSNLANKTITAALFKIFGLQPLDSVMEKLVSDNRDVHFFQKFFDAFGGLRVEKSPTLEAALKTIPAVGVPTVLMGNHAIQGKEGLAILSEYTKVRPDTKLIMTTYLNSVPGLEDYAYFLNPYGTPEARLHNERVMNEQIIPHLKSGGAVLILPSGEVSKKDKVDALPSEVPWKVGAAAMIAAVPKAQVQTFYTTNEASEFWYKIRRLADLKKTGRNRFEKAIGKLAWTLIPLIHLREFAHNNDQSIVLSLSRPIPAESLIKRFTNNRGTLQKPGLMRYLQAFTFSMRDRMVKNVDNRELQPIWTPVDEEAHKASVMENLAAFDSSPLVARGGVNVSLVHTQNIDIPLFTELGRAREAVFRNVGEGSGKTLDLDANDPYYHHFIAFDPKSANLLGSYRMGRMDMLANDYKRRAYNTESVEYSLELQKMLNTQGLEFGRSFVDKQAGKKALVAFFALWNRIGLFISDHSHYRYMTGPVSISNTYSLTAKKLIVAFLMKYKMHAKAASLAKAKVPFQFELNEYEKVLFEKVNTLEDLNQIVKEFDGEDAPPLLGIYDSLNGRYLTFSFDQDFNTVDGTILVDMHDMIGNLPLQTSYAKYMTQEGVDKYLKANSGSTAPLNE